MKPLLKVDDLAVRFRVKRGLFGRQSYDVMAVNGVSFELRRGETLGLVGESGAGKSTIGRALLRLTDLASGSILLDGTDVGKLRGRILDFRRAIFSWNQMVCGSPLLRLDPPYWTFSDFPLTSGLPRSFGLPYCTSTKELSTMLKNRKTPLGFDPLLLDSPISRWRQEFRAYLSLSASVPLGRGETGRSF